MRSLRVCLAVLLGCACAAAQVNTYLPPRVGGGNQAFSAAGGAGGGYRPGARGGFGGGGGGGGSGSRGQEIGIISLINENNGDGTYRYSYETENGIQAQEQGQLQDDGAEGVLRAQGSFAFTAPDDGRRYSVTYTADENGFQPQGEHLPTPPPIPEAIQRAIAQNAADEARGIVDDGQYRGAGAANGAGNGRYQGPSAPGQFRASNGGGSGGYPSNGGYQY